MAIYSGRIFTPELILYSIICSHCRGDLTVRMRKRSSLAYFWWMRYNLPRLTGCLPVIIEARVGVQIGDT